MQISKLGAAFPLASLGIPTRGWSKRKEGTHKFSKPLRDQPLCPSKKMEVSFFFFYKELIQRQTGLVLLLNPGGSWCTKFQENFTESNIEHPLKMKILATVQLEHTVANVAERKQREEWPALLSKHQELCAVSHVSDLDQVCILGLSCPDIFNSLKIRVGAIFLLFTC